jgi:xanthine dehydrogenase iron-sulfur cluster and FAD-binding subunit A
MILSCKSLLDHHPKPTRDQIRHAVSGNLCRCGTYPHVFEAVEKVAGLTTAASPALEPPLVLTAHGSRLTNDDRVDAGLADILEMEET